MCVCTNRCALNAGVSLWDELSVHTCVKVRQGCHGGVKRTPLWLPSACWHRRRKGTRLASITEWEPCVYVCLWSGKDSNFNDNYYYYNLFLVKYAVTDTHKFVAPNLDYTTRFSISLQFIPSSESFLCWIVNCKKKASHASCMSDYVCSFSCFLFLSSLHILFSLYLHLISFSPSPFRCSTLFLLPPLVFSLSGALHPSLSPYPRGQFSFLK